MEGEDEDEDGIRELRFVPADKGLCKLNSRCAEFI